MNPEISTVGNVFDWHPMLGDIIGGNIDTQYVAVSLEEKKFYCQNKTERWILRNTKAFKAIIGFFERMNAHNVLDHLSAGKSLLLDFNTYQILLVDDPQSAIDSPHNQPVFIKCPRSDSSNMDADYSFAMHWLINRYGDQYNDVKHRPVKKRFMSKINTHNSADVIKLEQWLKLKAAQ